VIFCLMHHSVLMLFVDYVLVYMIKHGLHPFNFASFYTSIRKPTQKGSKLPCMSFEVDSQLGRSVLRPYEDVVVIVLWG
jgi:hypothetical protein